ncbi:MAG: hypothetical protein WBL27_05580 [Salinimicrobium sp.]
MKQPLLLIISLFFCGISFAQTQVRTELKGNIKVPAGAEADGITIFNKTANKGSVADRKGDFEIPARLGDSLYFAAVQFKELLVVVDEKAMESQRLLVEIKEGVNQLPEVVVRDHDLTGNVAADVDNIEVVALDLPSLSAADIAAMYPNWFPASDGQSKIGNPAVAGGGGGGLKNGANPLAIIGMALDLLIPDKPKVKKEPEVFIGRIELEKQVREKFDDEFFADVLKIEKKEISKFFDFCEANGFPRELLKDEKEMNLIEYLLKQSELYRTA